MSDKSLKIIVDHREPSNIKKRLIKLGMKVEEQQLDVADYVISENVACERKTGKDLISSLVDNRLFEQIDRMIETYEQPILLIEDLPSAFERIEWKKRKKTCLWGFNIHFSAPKCACCPNLKNERNCNRIKPNYILGARGKS